MKAPATPVDGVRESKENTLDIFQQVQSSMKVVPALDAPDVRHEITLLGGVWEPPTQGKGGINRKAPRKGVCQKGLGVFCTRGKGGTQAWNPCRDPSPSEF